MPAFLRAQVSLEADTTVPADAAVNVFHFMSTTADDPADLITTLNVALEAFYDTIGGQLSSILTGNGSIKYYDMTDPEPRAPIGDDTFSFVPATASSYPPEVALCLSYQGEIVSGAPIARRRGRIYIGPVAASAGEISGARTQPNSTFRANLASAATALAGITGPPDALWSVFSPTTAGPPPWSESVLENSFFPILSGWIDNAWDTQRRRGQAATARTTWSA